MQLVKHWAAQLDDYVIDLAWSPDGEQLAATSSAGSISLYATQSGDLRHLLSGHEDGTNGLAWNPAHQSSLLASGGQEPRVAFWDATAGQRTATAELGNGGWVEHLAWKPVAASSETWLAAAAGCHLYALRDDGSVHHRFPPAPKSLSALAWSPSGKTLAAAYFGGVMLWDGSDFSLQKTLPYSGGIESLLWSPDGRWLVSGNHDPSVHLWRLHDDDELQMSGYETKVRALAFDARSRWLATSGSADCCVWDCSGVGPEGREPAMLPHEARICTVAFQNAHGLLAAASEDGTVKLWSVERALSASAGAGANPLRATVTMPAAATRLAWSPDDSLLAIGTTEGTVYTLKVSD